MAKKADIKRDLLDQLERKGVYGSFYLDLINNYMDFWEIEQELLKDAKENPYTEWRNSETSFGRKKNESVDQAVKINKQKMQILEFLGLKQPEAEVDYEDEEM